MNGLFSRLLTRECAFCLYTTPPRFAGALVHSRFHQGWDMGRDDDVYVSPMISKQAHGEALRFDRCGITSHPRSSEQNVDTRGVDARGATALSERGEADHAVFQFRR